jgi:hypothetical protein
MRSERFIAGQVLPEPFDPAPHVQRLGKALAKRKKAELIEALVELAGDDRKILRQLEARFDVPAPQDDLVKLIRQAITDATSFDERRTNYNFDYDYQAYESVQRNLKKLVEDGAYELAMELSLELMDQGSYQVEMSDEGLMTEDIEGCLKGVLQGLKHSDLPAEAIVDWCDAMSRADRIGFVCDKELKSLRKRFAN